MRSLAFALPMLLLLASPARAGTIVLDFEEEPIGYKDWSFVSVECGCVSFAYGSRADDDEPHTAVHDWSYPTGKGLTFASDQTMPLTLSFFSVVDSLSLDFQAGRTDNGNRADPWDGVIPPGAQAVLTVFLGATKLGEARVRLDLVSGGMDQTIGISGVGGFDRAVLRYAGAELSPTIDNVIFSTVPEPGTLSLALAALVIGGSVVLRASRGRRLSQCALAFSLLLLAAPTSAATIALDFEEEAIGYYYDEPGFVSAECGCVRVSDFAGRELAVFDYYLGTRVVSPGWKGEGGSLLLEFLVPVVGLSLDFVSFYPNARPIERPIDYKDAHLIAYAGGEIVGETTLTPDPTGPLFQTISLFPGTVIEQARFVRVALGFYEPISPFVDNVMLTTVPEPGSLGLAVLVLAGAASRLSAPAFSSRGSIRR